MADPDSDDPMPRSPPFDAAASSSQAAAGPAVAFDSHPSEVVLIQSYLRPWVARGVRANAFVHVADLYSAEPGDLARRHPAAVSRGGERAWYFLSPLRTKSPRGIGSRKSRTVAGGAGCWHIEGKLKPVLDPLHGNRKVGYRQSLSFLKPGDGDGAPAVRNGWIMVEFSLHHSGGGGGGDRLDGLVLCKVYRSPRHPDSAAAALADDDGEGSCAAAPAARHSDADDGDGGSDAPLPAAAGGERKAEADDEEGSSAANAATPRRHSKNADDVDVEASGAAAAAAPRLKKRAEPDDENGNSSGDAAPGLKEMAADKDSSASSPAHKRAKTADDEGLGAASASKNMQAGAPVTQLHCPECGFHLGALELVVTPAKSTSETETRQRHRAVETRVTFQ